MSDRVFVDTNVLVYCFDKGETKKRARALELLSDEVKGIETAPTPRFVISTQVLQEFYVTVTRKLSPPLSEADAERAAEKLAVLPIVQIDRSTVLAAIRTSRRYQLSLWDALILQAAFEGGCGKVLTEDLQEGFTFESVVVENPFRDL